MTEPNAAASGPEQAATETTTSPEPNSTGQAAGGTQATQPSDPQAGGSTEPQTQAGIEALLAEAQARANEYMDRALRAQADLENLRKRSQLDVAAAHKFAIERFAESLLAVHDSLEMALRVEAPSLESLREGVQATLRQLDTAFERNKLLAIDPAGQKFDPNQHQAISMVPAPGVAANTVVAVMQKGFLINERVLRPAMVTVSNGQG
ncbi:MAG: nucleotide exchange factor GrpE [Burkholderiaceae bacterium]